VGLVDLSIRSGVVDPHSGPITNARITTASDSLTAENAVFEDMLSHPSYAMDNQVDSTRTMQDSDVADLGNFMKRPIKIAEYTWNVGSPLDVNFNPWDLYFTNNRVSNRISNYNLMRSNLKLKAVINGNGFHYGRLIMSYLPFDVFDSLSVISGDDAHLVQASQLPHIFLDPTKSQGGELTLPFFSYTNYVSIPNEGWGELGQVYLRSMNVLKHANNATDKVTISIFAMAEDLHMSVLTSLEPASITPQMGKETEEVNEHGIVSGPATAIAKVAASLSMVPIIKPFAMATNVAATATATIAKLFGYARPVETRSPESFRPLANSSLAVTNTGDTCHKMTVDSNQELTVDPRISGVGSQDEMTITSIASRESYVTKFTWSNTAAPETLLWNTAVSPVTWAESATGSLNFPACAAAAMPFQYWKGTLKYRFQFVCSAYHKGRIRFSYDPNYQSGLEYNTNFIRIIDLAETNDYTITVSNGQVISLLDHAIPGLEAVTEVYKTTAFASEPKGNGVLSVSVVNELTTPNSSVNNDIEVNVFISAGDDFEVFVPARMIGSYVVKPQSGSGIVPDADLTADSNAPIQTVEKNVGPEFNDVAQLNSVYTGEAIASFRQMLKRYNFWTGLGDLGSKLVYGRRSQFPYLRGNVANAVNSTTLAAPYNYCNTLLLHWVTLCYSGYRGSIRYKMLPIQMGDERDSIDYLINRAEIDPLDPLYVNGTTTSLSFASNVDATVIGMPGADPTLPTSWFDGSTGVVYQNGRVNQACEFEVPYYSRFRFTPGKQESHTGNALFDGAWDYRMQMKTNNSATLQIFVAAGEDFQTYFFTGLPPMYYEAVPPT
jgi:hypothetical protein